MKKVFCAIAVAAIGSSFATEAMAQAASRDINLNATVNAFCRIAGSSAVASQGWWESKEASSPA
jgi:hypothetical protein